MSNPPLSNEKALEALFALEIHGNISDAAKYLKLPRNTFNNRVDVARRRGLATTSEQLQTLHGFNPEHDLTHPVPSPLILRGTSTLYDENGKPKLQWVKTKLDDQKVEAAIKASIEALAEGMPRAKKISAPKEKFQTNLCNLYTLTDLHVGMRSWKHETGDDWDLDIAEDTITNAFSYLVSSSPTSETCIINQLGDFLHFDSLAPVTPTSGHLLDVDSRYSKVVKVATRILRHIIDQALIKHQKVIVLIAEGNHDQASSVWLRHLFSLLYENEPRVSVIDSEFPYYCYSHGETMLAFHHGHLSKNDNLPLLFAAQFAKEWGKAKRRYCHTGHYHHYHAKEHSGMIVIQHPTIAARDAYAARGGWISDRRIIGITYHSEHGEVSTNSVVPEMFD